ncbi:MAG: hypothetical protein JNM56_04710 [Planctomycetia bacterium]|nr:hypothetical protein [Planctomycetia bacterium]
MSEVMEPAAVATPTETVDLNAALLRVLQDSAEPLTVPKIRAQLPPALRSQNLEESLQRQVAATAVVQYPKYRSAQERYWDRPMPVHVAALLQSVLEEGALSAGELRRKLPAYAHELFEQVMQEEIANGKLYRHPKLGGRGGERIGVRPAEPKEYLRPELAAVFRKLEPLGFSTSSLRAAALEMLHDEEWAPAPAVPSEAKPSEQLTAPAPSALT